MLVLSRKRGEKILLRLPTDPLELQGLAGVTIEVIHLEQRHNGVTRIGIQCPRIVGILRSEIADYFPVEQAVSTLLPVVTKKLSAEEQQQFRQEWEELYKSGLLDDMPVKILSAPEERLPLSGLTVSEAKALKAQVESGCEV